MRVGEVFVECVEKTGFRDFGVFPQGDEPALRARTVLTLAIPLEGLPPEAGQIEVAQRGRCVQQRQPYPGRLPDRLEFPAELIIVQRLPRLLVVAGANMTARNRSPLRPPGAFRPAPWAERARGPLVAPPGWCYYLTVGLRRKPCAGSQSRLP